MIGTAEQDSLERHDRIRELLERQKQSNEARLLPPTSPDVRLTKALEMLYLESFVQGQRIRVLEDKSKSRPARRVRRPW